MSDSEQKINDSIKFSSAELATGYEKVLELAEKDKNLPDEENNGPVLLRINNNSSQQEMFKANQEKLNNLRQRLKKEDGQRIKKIKLYTKRTLSSDLVLFILIFAVLFLAFLILIIKKNY